MSTAKICIGTDLRNSGGPVRATPSTHAARHEAVGTSDPVLELFAENAQLREELARLHDENGDLRASAALWIRCYEAACERCRDVKRS